MKKESIYLKVDSRKRITLTKLLTDLPPFYKAYVKDSKIILEPVQEVPETEAWLFLPENKEILAKIKKSLTQEATIDFASLKKQLKIK